MKNTFHMTRLSAILLAAIILLLLVFVVFMPFWQKWNALEERMSTLLSQYASHSMRVEKLEDIVSIYRDYEAVAIQKGSDEEENALFFKEIEALLKDTGVVILDIKPREIERSHVGNQFFVEVSLQGSVTQLIDILYALATSDTLICIEEIRLEPEARKQDVHSISLLFSKVFLS